jgi:hypothetical protein
MQTKEAPSAEKRMDDLNARMAEGFAKSTGRSTG